MQKFDEPDTSGYIYPHNLPEVSGVYIVTDIEDNVLYVGSTNCLRRIIAYLEAHVFDNNSQKYLNPAADPLFRYQADGNAAKVHYIECEDYGEKAKKLKVKYRPPWNKR